MAGRSRNVAGDARGHVVKVYDDDRDLMAEVSDFVAAGIAAGDVVILVATPAHRHALEQLGAFDLRNAVDAGQYVALDADELLAEIVVDGVPDRSRLRAVVGRLIGAAAPRPVRVFGEMVSILWDDGDVSAAILLEDMWNELARDHAFSLLCAYPRSSFGDGAAFGSIRQVCGHHDDVVAPASYASGTPASDGPEGSPPAATSVSEVFLPVPLAIRAARAFVARTLSAWGEPGPSEDAALVVSELATNAVRHAGSPFQVSLARRGDTVRVSVHDAGDGSPASRSASPAATDGRGLALVAAVSSSWGVDPVADGKIVWADLAA
jgi:hypothetical protein